MLEEMKNEVVAENPVIAENVIETPEDVSLDADAVFDAAIREADEKLAVAIGERLDDSKSGEDHAGTGTPAPENSDAPAPASAEQDADANSGEQKNGEDYEDADTVIDGFASTEFAKLSEEAKTALETYCQDVQAKIAEAEAAKAKAEALLGDPVIKARADALISGRTAAVRGLTNAERHQFVDAVNKVLGLETDTELSSEEAKNLMAQIEVNLDGIARTMAQDYANQMMTISDQMRKTQETTRAGQELFLGLGKINPALKVEETDFNKFYNAENGKMVLNESHPEIETFKNGIGKIYEWAGRNGMSFEQVLAMGADALYAAAGTALKMPVVANAEERDKKIAAAAVTKALRPFLKPKAGSTPLSVEPGAVSAQKGEEYTVVHGFKAELLVTNPEYRKALEAKHFDDDDMLEKIAQAADAGRVKLEQRKN